MPQLIAFPRIPVGARIADFFTWLTDNLSGVFELFSTALNAVVNGFITVLEFPNPIVMAVIFALIGLAIRGWKFGLGSLLGMLFIIGMDQWATAMQTLALVLVATIVAVVIAIPLGVLAASSQTSSSVIKPLMDLMQTMPAFVWLVPVVTLFGIGVVPGVVATIIFALPPGVRFTELGIRNVDSEVVEASQAFGATSRQTLFGVQLPLAMPTIMAGVNQVIMLALSMAVIAGLVGAEGLGGQVSAAIATLDLGLGFEAGLAVVILAIFLDRVTASLGHGGSLARLRALRRGKQPSASTAINDAASEEAEEAVAEAELHTKIGA